MIAARVAEAETLHPGLRRITLEPAAGGLFPAAAPGAHVMLEMRHGERVWRNAYSVASPSDPRTRYVVVVRRVEGSRGGSAWLHDHLVVGERLNVSMPLNLFPIAATARKHLMLAGGIGVTPFLSYLPALANAPHELHLRCRADEFDAFASLLAPWPMANVYHGPALDVASLLGDQPLGTHLYVCGPSGFMAHVVATATALGWPAARLHQEHFGGAAPGHAFTAALARSGVTITVAADQGLLDALEAAGVDAPFLCRGGACGECRVGVLGGAIDHRDHVLTDAERAVGDAMMPCVSRAASDALVLDI